MYIGILAITENENDKSSMGKGQAETSNEKGTKSIEFLPFLFRKKFTSKCIFSKTY